VIEAKPSEKMPLEAAVEHAIEVGAEDVTELENAEDNALQVSSVTKAFLHRLSTYRELFMVFFSLSM
jgi:hypothetical protein